MKYLVLFLITYHHIVLAASLSPREQQELLLKTIYNELFARVEKIQKDLPIESSGPVSINQGKRGKLIVERLRQKNLAKIAKQKGLDPEKYNSGKAIVKGEQAENKKFIQHMTQVRKELEQLKQRSLRPLEWNAKYKELYLEWQKQKEKYKKNIKIYQENTIDIPVVMPVSKKERHKKIEVKIKKEYYFVSDAFTPMIKDQMNRPTCSAFAGIRAIEIGLAQEGLHVDLSEQYLYWASKSDCQRTPCRRAGSWVGDGLLFSQQKSQMDIPTELNCPYNPQSLPNNQTQIPLMQDCHQGVAKVKNFTYLKTLDDVINKIMQNRPVLVGLKLTPNFYQNNGLILASEALKGPDMDSHSAGHALLLVGVVKLPSVLNEGEYCFVAANSWGVGWAQGGYSCISEKWMLQNRNINPFVFVDSIAFKK